MVGATTGGPQGGIRPVLVGMAALGAIGLLGIVLVGLSLGDDRAEAIGTLLLTAVASFAAAGVAGFLFGLPTTKGAAADRGPGLSPSTKLDGVSDWLSTLLLGATLTQVGALVAWSGDLFTTIGEQFEETGGGATVAGAVVVFFAASGFISAWLAARLQLGRALSEADRALEKAEGFAEAAEAAREGGHRGKSRELTQRALDVLAEAGEFADRYEGVRGAQASGPDRTRQLESILRQARSQALEAGEELTRREVRALFQSGKEGARICALAYMQARTELLDVPSIVDAIRSPRSAFEQYHALLAAQAVADVRLVATDRGSMEQLLRAIEDAEAAGTLRHSGSRVRLAREIREKLAAALTQSSA